MSAPTPVIPDYDAVQKTKKRNHFQRIANGQRPLPKGKAGTISGSVAPHETLLATPVEDERPSKVAKTAAAVENGFLAGESCSTEARTTALTFTAILPARSITTPALDADEKCDTLMIDNDAYSIDEDTVANQPPVESHIVEDATVVNQTLTINNAAVVNHLIKLSEAYTFGTYIGFPFSSPIIVIGKGTNPHGIVLMNTQLVLQAVYRVGGNDNDPLYADAYWAWMADKCANPPGCEAMEKEQARKAEIESAVREIEKLRAFFRRDCSSLTNRVTKQLKAVDKSLVKFKEELHTLNSRPGYYNLYFDGYVHTVYDTYDQEKTDTNDVDEEGVLSYGGDVGAEDADDNDVEDEGYDTEQELWEDGIEDYRKDEGIGGLFYDDGFPRSTFALPTGLEISLQPSHSGMTKTA